MVKRLTKLLLLFFMLSLNSVGDTSSLFFDTSIISGNSITTGCWVAPTAPALNLPADNLITGNSDINFSWFASSSSCPQAEISYKYEISDDVLFSNIIVTSNWTTDLSYTYTNIPEGKYFWRVLTKDQFGNISTGSLRNLTIDHTLPSSVITAPVNSGNNQIDISITSWDGNIEGTASDSLSGLDRVEISIQKDLDKFWNGTDWVSGSENSVRVWTTGTTNWNYQVSGSIPSGSYRIISHAVDKAGNIENSATIEFKNIIPASAVEPTSTPIETPVPTPTETVVPTETPIPIPTETIVPTVTPVPALEINLSSSHTSRKIYLKVINISSPMDYEILYTGNGLEKGITGHISSEEIIDSEYSKDFYLGTCTTGGSCTPEIVQIGSALTINLTGGETLTKTFNY